MNAEKYKKFVDILVDKYGAIWVAIIMQNGEISAYKAKNEKHQDRYLRITRSFFWTLMSIGDMANMPDLEGKYLEIVWNKIYLYMFQLEDENLMIATNTNIEDFVIKIISDMATKSAPKVPGLIGFGIGDYKGKTLSTFIDMNVIRNMGGKNYNEEEVKKIFEDTTKIIFDRFLFMGNAGFGDGKYMEVKWEHVSGWMFPYKDKVAAAIFTTSKIDTIINLLSYVLGSVGD